MKKTHWADWISLGVILLLAVLYGWNLLDIPFHPDESTHIYMSKDMSSLVRDPLSLAWDGELPFSDEERIRAIDAPLAKYLIGIVRGISGIPPLESDWNWSLSWEENQSAGALPSDQQLLFARFASTILLPFSLWLYYLALKKFLPAFSALAAVILMGISPLILLHGRRAMSESSLVFGMALFLWSATRERRNPWLIGLALGIAINAKHSALGLFPAAVYAASLLTDQAGNLKKAAAKIFQASLIMGLTIFLLNPFYWKQPLRAINASLQARFSLASDQQEDHLGQTALPGQPLKITVPGLILNTYLTLPQTEEVGNYLAETNSSREMYLANPIHSLGRDRISASLLAALTLIGMGWAGKELPGMEPGKRRNFLILGLATLGMGAFLAFLLPWQRYAVALLPFTFGWVGAGLAPVFKFLE